MATTLLTRYGYPKVPGDQPEGILDVSGPTNYTPLIPGSPGPPIVLPTGGQAITAQDFGLQSFTFVTGTGSTDGNYFVVVVPLLVQSSLPTQLPDGSFSKILLAWMNVDAEGQASGDLSHSTVRLFARGW